MAERHDALYRALVRGDAQSQPVAHPETFAC